MKKKKQDEVAMFVGLGVVGVLAFLMWRSAKMQEKDIGKGPFSTGRVIV